MQADENIPLTAIVPYSVFPSRMGGQKGIALFYAWLGKELPVHMVLPSGSSMPNGYPATPYPVLGKGIRRYCNPFLINRVRAIIKQTGSKVLILEHPYLGWLGWWVKKLTGIKLAVHSHNIESMRFKSTGKWWWGLMWHYEKLVHRSADINFFVTDEDREFAISRWGLKAERCHTIPYGFDNAGPPSAAEKASAARFLRNRYGIPEHHKILLFNGTLSYGPNLDALTYILEKINPGLQEVDSNHTIIICGKGLPEQYNDTAAYRQQNVVFAGFVDDITPYYLGADIFLNPVSDGGGIKTKLVEALGYNLTAISTKNGAAGVPLPVTGNKLLVTENNDWNTFINYIISTHPQNQIPEAFFNYFYWARIAKKAAQAITASA